MSPYDFCSTETTPDNNHKLMNFFIFFIFFIFRSTDKKVERKKNIRVISLHEAR